MPYLLVRGQFIDGTERHGKPSAAHASSSIKQEILVSTQHVQYTIEAEVFVRYIKRFSANQGC